MHISDIEPDLLRVILNLANAANTVSSIGGSDDEAFDALNDALCDLPKEIRVLLDSPILTVEEWDVLLAEHDAITDALYHVEPS